METKNQDRISELVEKQKDTYTSMADEIWGYAEPRFQEYESSRVQQEYLASRGFSIRADLAGEKTAFIAEWGSGKPVLAFLGEFDALSSLQQEADCTERRPIAGKTDGHGCGHHLLGTASVAAVDALKSYMEEKDLKGTIRYYGCPAEENAAERHIWSGTDISMTVISLSPGIQARRTKQWETINFLPISVCSLPSMEFPPMRRERRSLDVLRWMQWRSWTLA